LRAAIRVFQGNTEEEVGGKDGITTDKHIVWLSDQIRVKVETVGLWHRLLNYATGRTGPSKVWAKALNKELRKLHTQYARLLAPVM
jgi:hypothetical protein